METRKQLVAKAKANTKIIEKLQAENLKLLRKSYLLCDKTSRFEEKEETFGRGKNKKTELRGRIYFKQTFVDPDTGHKIKIERNRIVRVNGEWV